MNIIIVDNNQEVGSTTGEMILEKVRQNPNTILGLATGSSPISTYEYVVNKTEQENIDWSNVITFNLDEYKGLAPEHDQSYRYFMNEKLFDKINIKKENTFVPSGLIDTDEEANKYDDLIASKGGIDLQLLGIGTNGHIGFNEPGTSFDSITSIVDLTKSTIEANARFFASEADVPTQAISMGLNSIMQAKEIVLIAIGANKAEAIYELARGKFSPEWPCTILQNHPNVTLVLDQEAASKLQ
ncbi:glucosamine-6-phosphate deaminase [Spiroplasma culicicola]|uniref:Glucosamine-6-phosphate deaminase n=1 Tax=Spiroplasma culicicola AES-1 TaxID=1276246 RepID=W6A5X6_9MOLU|nr:glucosamine-6-phosphate deaminase [Spiroplasma culicicola]AHI52538.1 glucosamine-6-phosphate deaminase [Spiroplasma culicicola AES-1]